MSIQLKPTLIHPYDLYELLLKTKSEPKEMGSVKVHIDEGNYDADQPLMELDGVLYQESTMTPPKTTNIR